MSMDVGGGARGEVKSDINVTPLVDVMLVLLIIMMVVAPMLQKGVNVKLPQAANTADKPETQEQTVVAITATKDIFVNQKLVREEELAAKVQESLESKKEKTVLIKGDEDAPYSAIMAAMDELRKANIENIGLVTEKKARAAGGAGGGR
jgi:biopolymer transport protein TolR